MEDRLSLRDTIALHTIISAAQRTKRVRWLDEGGTLFEGVARAITRDGGGFTTDDEDVRDAYLHVSGIGEWWIPVRRLIDMVKRGEFAVD